MEFIVIAKPDSLSRGMLGIIISEFEQRDFKILDMQYLHPVDSTKQKYLEHYGEYTSLGFFENLIKFCMSGPSVVMKMKGDIQVARNIVGSKIPWETPNSIRGRFSCQMPQNLVHCSDLENAREEVEVWFGNV